MKKGFTLAEILITLAIIGIIATLTLPALITNIAEQRAKTALKKTINTLVEAGEMNAVQEGFSYGHMASDNVKDIYGDNGVMVKSLYAILKKNAHILSIETRPSQNDIGNIRIDVYDSQNRIVSGAEGSTFAFQNEITFMDGTTLIFNPSPVNNENDGIDDPVSPSYNYVLGVVDVNGSKGPNQLSTCGSDNGRSCSNIPDASLCNNKSQRGIKDRFPVMIGGMGVIPCTPAGMWTFNN